MHLVPNVPSRSDPFGIGNANQQNAGFLTLRSQMPARQPKNMKAGGESRFSA